LSLTSNQQLLAPRDGTARAVSHHTTYRSATATATGAALSSDYDLSSESDAFISNQIGTIIHATSLPTYAALTDCTIWQKELIV